MKEKEETPADPEAYAMGEESPCEYRSESHTSSVLDSDTSSSYHWVPEKNHFLMPLSPANKPYMYAIYLGSHMESIALQAWTDSVFTSQHTGSKQQLCLAQKSDF